MASKSANGNTQPETGIISSMFNAPEPEVPPWTFLTNHAHVLIAISRNSDARQRDIAYAVGLTVGAIQRIIRDLEGGGYLVSERIGRRNHYRVIGDKPLRHPLESTHTVHDLIASVADE